MTLSKINVFYLTPLFPSHQQAKLLSVEFKQISAEEREKWDKLAREDKERYQREMEDYEPPSDDEEEVTKKKRKKDPNAPKRNMSAYFTSSICSKSLRMGSSGLDFPLPAAVVPPVVLPFPGNDELMV